MPKKLYLLFSRTTKFVCWISIGTLEVKDGSTLYFHRTEQRGQISFFLGRGLGSLPGGQRLLGPGDDGGTTEGSLGQVLPVSLLVEDGLDLVQGPPGTSLHGGGNHGLGGSETILGSLGGHHKAEMF